MKKIEKRWMAYIDSEVRGACEEKGWGYQIRRKWSVREKPVSKSSIEDYEWKLSPGSAGGWPDISLSPTDFGECIYFILQFDRSSAKLVLQHDTRQGGADIEPYWDLESYTHIRLGGWFHQLQLHREHHPTIQGQVEGTEHDRLLAEPGPEGWLRDHLVELTTRFQPNQYSIS